VEHEVFGRWIKDSGQRGIGGRTGSNLATTEIWKPAKLDET